MTIPHGPGGNDNEAEAIEAFHAAASMMAFTRTSGEAVKCVSSDDGSWLSTDCSAVAMRFCGLDESLEDVLFLVIDELLTLGVLVTQNGDLSSYFHLMTRKEEKSFF